jgi:hypothetical protein
MDFKDATIAWYAASLPSV